MGEVVSVRMKAHEQRIPAYRHAKKAVTRVAGFSAVAALFSVAPDRVERLFFEARARAMVAPFCAELGRAHKPYRLVTNEELGRIAGTILHGGIVAIARPQPVHVFDPDTASLWAQDGQPLLILDGVSNPHNLGAIARTAAFFGLPRMMLSDHPMQASPSDASYRVSEGGLEYLELYRVHLRQVLKRIKNPYRVVAAAPGRYRALAELRSDDKPFALVLGNEEEGLPSATLAACDDVVAIPGRGRIQSLNVAASAAILLYVLSAASRLRKRIGFS
jgi:RNA methyltransferase, TrmH family